MKKSLTLQTLLALLLALLVGSTLQLFPESFANFFLQACSFLGTIFLNALKMLIIPLIVPSIICGMKSLGAEKNFKRIGVKTLAYYLSSGLIAILIGLFFVNLIQPGQLDEATKIELQGAQEDPSAFIDKVQDRGMGDFLNIFVRMVPPNVLDAATNNGQLLGVIFFCLLAGYFIGKLPTPLRETQDRFWESTLELVTRIAVFIINFTPIGVFALVTPVIAETGIHSLAPLAKFFSTVILGLATHAFIALPLLLVLFGCNPHKHFKQMSPALLTAFSTASSASTLPVTMECVEKNPDVPQKISSFTLPLGATVNMDGTALYECVVVLFIAQMYGVALSVWTQLSVVTLALVTSIGVAGIPSASLVAIAVILGALELPVEAIGIVLVTDRILDMCRTAVNVFSDTCAAVIVAKSEKAG